MMLRPIRLHDEFAHLLRRAEWKSNPTACTLERARAYARDGRVHDLRWRAEKKDGVFPSQTTGSHGAQYDCEIDFRGYGE